MSELEEELISIVQNRFRNVLLLRSNQDVMLLERGVESLGLGELLKLDPGYADQDQLRYYRGLLLLRLEEGPLDFNSLPHYQKAAELLHYAPEYFVIIANACDTILTMQIIQAQNENELIAWAEEAYKIWWYTQIRLPLEERKQEERRTHGAELEENPKVVNNALDFAHIVLMPIIWEKSAVLCDNQQDIQSFLHVLRCIHKAKLFEFDVEALVLAVVPMALECINSNLQRGHEIMHYVKMINVEDEAIKKSIEETDIKLSQIEHAPIPMKVNEQIEQFRRLDQYATISQNSVGSSSTVYAQPITNFHVSISKANFMGKTVAVKTYRPSIPNPDLSRILGEIEIYQQLGKYANEENCFLKYYGTYVEDNSINMVMEFYEQT